MGLSREEFLALIDAAKPTINRPDDQQGKAVFEAPDANLFIVAGPGTGKTACLTYRALYLIFVADFRPDGILATTFTKKAAAELRSRILGWGYRMIDVAQSVLAADRANVLRSIDLNQIRTGTLDSICESILREHRAPGEEPPVLTDEYVAKTVLIRDGLLSSGLYKDDALGKWLLQLRNGATWGYNLAAKASLLRSIGDRRHNDLIDFNRFVKSGPRSQRKGRNAVLSVFDNYDAAMTNAGVMDFAQLEHKFGDGLKNGGYTTFTKTLQSILVDEYQDTNLLQELIYYGLAKSSGAPLTVVGDDDQSLYRFRGATVELFSDFPRRLHQSTCKKIVLKLR
jgi:DNA helicase-2/ATP-dependent DNA helicase PcrA